MQHTNYFVLARPSVGAFRRVPAIIYHGTTQPLFGQLKQHFNKNVNFRTLHCSLKACHCVVWWKMGVINYFTRWRVTEYKLLIQYYQTSSKARLIYNETCRINADLAISRGHLRTTP